MIQGFRCRKTQAFFSGGAPAAQWKRFATVAYRKLTMLDDAVELRDLAALPGNRLEALKGDRKGQYSMLINDQWRICFRWHAQGPTDVEITDYH